MDKTENVRQFSKDNTKSHGDQLDGLFNLHLLADVVEQESLLETLNSTPSNRDGLIRNDSIKSVEKAMDGHMRIHPDGGNKRTQMPLDTKQTSEPRLVPVSRSGWRISATWKVKENLGRKLESERKCEIKSALVYRSERPITISRKVKENIGGMNPALDSQEMLATARILLEMSNDKSGACIWGFPQRQDLPSIIVELTEKNLDEPAQLNAKKCINETTAQGSGRKRKLPSGEIQGKAGKKMKSGPHVCGICGKIFATGVQLGGHKRAHYEKEPAESVNCWFIRKSADSELPFKKRKELRFFLTIRKNDKCVSSDGNDL